MSFPDQKQTTRTSSNTGKTRKYRHRQVRADQAAVLAALYTEICLAIAGDQALGEGYDRLHRHGRAGASRWSPRYGSARMLAAGGGDDHRLACWANGSVIGAREETAAGSRASF